MEDQLISEQGSRAGFFREILVVLFKHKLQVLIVFSLIVGVVTAYALRLDPIYIAKSTFLVKIEREYLLRPGVGNNAPMMSLGQEGIINAIEILRSRELTEKVITQMGVSTIYPDIATKPHKNMLPLDVAVNRFEKRLAVEAVNRSNVIKVSLEHENPLVAAAAVNLLIELYKDKHLKVFSEPHSVYLEQQLNEYARKFKDSEGILESFRRNTQIYSLEEQRNMLSQQRIELDTALKASTNSISELQGRVAVLRSQLSDVTSDATDQERETNIHDAKSKQIGLAGSFLKEQELVAKRKARLENPLYLELRKALLAAEADLKAQTPKAEAIKSQMRSLDHALGSLNVNEQRLADLIREKTVAEKNYLSYRERAEESRRLDDMNRLKLANISIIQPATPPGEPSKPNRLKMILLGILSGTVLGVGSAFVSEYRAKTLCTPEQVERFLGVPVLLSIPYHER